MHLGVLRREGRVARREQNPLEGGEGEARRACNRMQERLQPYARGAAALCGLQAGGGGEGAARRAVGGISVRLHLEEVHRLLLHGVITR